MLYLRTHVLVSIQALATVTGSSLAGRLMVVVNIYQKEQQCLRFVFWNDQMTWNLIWDLLNLEIYFLRPLT